MASTAGEVSERHEVARGPRFSPECRAGLDDGGQLIYRANSVEFVRPRELALHVRRADGGRTGSLTNSFTNSSECGCPKLAPSV